MNIEELLEEAKRRYPVGTTYWNLDLTGNRSNTSKNAIPHTLTGEVDPCIWHTKYNGFPVILRGSSQGFVYSGGVWAEIVSTPELNTFGLKIGDVLLADTLNTWVKLNDGENCINKLDLPKGIFGLDRRIESFELFDKISVFKVSHTSNAYLKAEGFKEFSENFNKPIKKDPKIGEFWFYGKGLYKIEDIIEDKAVITSYCKSFAINKMHYSLDVMKTRNAWKKAEFKNIDKTDMTLEQFNEVDEYFNNTSNNFILPKTWYVDVDENNLEVLSEWRFGKNSHRLSTDNIIGMCQSYFKSNESEKGHNPKKSIEYNKKWFVNKITFEQFKQYVLKETVIQQTVIKKHIEENNKLHIPIITKSAKTLLTELNTELPKLIISLPKRDIKQIKQIILQKFILTI